jgi:hypothetical protein
MGARLDSDPHRGCGFEALFECSLAGLQPAFLENLARAVQCTEVAVLISKINSNRDFVFSLMFHGQFPLGFEPV